MGIWNIIIPQAGANLISNPSFETGLTGYSAIGGAALAQSTAQNKYGLNSCRITPVSGVAGGASYTVSGLTGGADYTFSVALKGANGRSYTLQAEADSSVVGSLTLVSDGEWARYALSFTMPGGITEIILSVFGVAEVS